MSTIICHCGNQAILAIHFTNFNHAHWNPVCEQCYHTHLENAQDTNDHELRHFDGAYGLVTWEERSLDNAAQDDKGYIVYQNDDEYQPPSKPDIMTTDPKILTNIQACFVCEVCGKSINDSEDLGSVGLINYHKSCLLKLKKDEHAKLL